MSHFYYLPDSYPRPMSQRIQAPPFREHIFYSGIALAFGLCVFVGFSRTYYLKGLFGTPHLSWLAHLHGAMFTAWTVFFLCQVALVAAGRTDLHRRIGRAGAVVGAGVLMLGIVMALHSVHVGYATGRPGMASLLINAFMNLFAFFLRLAYSSAGRKEIHKRLMVLAMLSLIIPDWENVYVGLHDRMGDLCLLLDGRNLRHSRSPPRVPYKHSRCPAHQRSRSFAFHDRRRTRLAEVLRMDRALRPWTKQASSPPRGSSCDEGLDIHLASRRTKALCTAYE
jgi:hypothetical protein